MADQSLAIQDQRLTSQDANSKLERAKRLLSFKALLPWILALSTFGKFIYQSLNFASVVEFAAGLGRNPHLKTVLDFILSPLGQILMTVLGIAWLAYLVVRKEPQKPSQSGQLQRTAFPATPRPTPDKRKPKLTFEIDEQNSQVHVETQGPRANRIKADIKVRCEKETDSTMAVRGFHLSLHRKEADGTETVVPHHEELRAIWEDSTGVLVAASDGWTIEKPRTDYRYYSFALEITPTVQADLSSDHFPHFLQVTMDAIGQDPQSKPVYVKDWADSEGTIRLKPVEPYPLEAQKEISSLKEQLVSYEKTNENLGRYNQQFESLIALAKKHRNAIDDYVKVTDCERGDLTLQPRDLISHPKVMLCLWITNKSLLEIAISNDLAGNVEFEGTELRESKKIVNTITSLETGDRQCLTIEQRLSDSDVSMLLRSQHSTRPLYFNFDNLILNIIGGKRSPDIKATRLKIDKNKQALAFPVSLLERLQRVRVFSEIRGHCIQLHEPLRKASDPPLPIADIEYWRNLSLETLQRVYSDEGAKRLWQEITKGEPIPTSGPFQQGWLRNCIIQLGGMLEEEAGQYIRNTQNSLTEQLIS